jgi:hypothetical protein
MEQGTPVGESFYETPFRLKDGRTLLLRSKNAFPMGDCPYQVFDAEIFTPDEYANLHRL